MLSRIACSIERRALYAVIPVSLYHFPGPLDVAWHPPRPEPGDPAQLAHTALMVHAWTGRRPGPGKEAPRGGWRWFPVLVATVAALSASAAASCDHGSVDQTNVKSIASGEGRGSALRGVGAREQTWSC